MITERVVVDVDTSDAKAAASTVRGLANALGALDSAGRRRAADGKFLANPYRIAAQAVGEEARAVAQVAVVQAQVNREVEEEVRLRAKLASFDAGRVRRMHEMRQQLKRQTKIAQGQDPNGLGPTLPRREMGGIGGMVNSFVGNAAADFAAGAARSAVNLAKQSAVAAFNAAAFKEDTLRALTTLTGSAEEGRHAFEAGARLSSEIGGKPFENLANMQTLMARGFDLEGPVGALEVLRGMADLKVISPKASIENVVTAIAQIRSKGKLSLEELQGQLGEQFDVSAVVGRLSKTLGKTGDEIRDMISAGKIDANTGILAVLEAIQEKTGKGLGGAAKEARNGLSGLREQLDAWPENFLLALETDGGRVKGFMRDVVDAVDPTKESGKELVKSTNELADAVGGLFSKGDGEGGKRIESVVKALAGFEGGFAEGLKEASPILEGVLTTIGKMTGLEDNAKAARLAGQAFGILAIGVATALTAMVGLELFVVGHLNSVMNGLDALTAPAATKGQAIGQAIVRGLLAALTFGISEVFLAGGQLVEAADQGMTTKGKIASPSKLTFGRGEQLGDGLVGGMDRSQSIIAAAGAAMVQAATPSIGVPAAPAGGGARASVHVGSVTVQVGGGMAAAGGGTVTPQKAGAEAGRAFWVEVRRLAEQGI